MGMSWEVAHMAAPHMAALPPVARMDTSREFAHMAANRDLLRSRYQQVAAERRQPPVPHSLAHKMKREWQSLQ
jgi:hypothetical protein